ncbi:hypothetical protein BDV59DRAFT_71564 [Aspergillus ambiguus]|uniref:uncharacterized protein n=1 Tax=Aspergillus ambiguus TaxID=176160 RepID=UPI003CCE3A89
MQGGGLRYLTGCPFFFFFGISFYFLFTLGPALTEKRERARVNGTVRYGIIEMVVRLEGSSIHTPIYCSEEAAFGQKVVTFVFLRRLASIYTPRSSAPHLPCHLSAELGIALSSITRSRIASASLSPHHQASPFVDARLSTRCIHGLGEPLSALRLIACHDPGYLPPTIRLILRHSLTIG